MKLKIQAAVLAAIIGAGMAGNASATTIGGGKIYDVGKGSYSADKAAYAPDTVLCWAAASSNMIQYWQDQYGSLAADGTPNGYAGQPYGQPDGTRYLAVYEQFLASSTADQGGRHCVALDWWFKNEGNAALKAKDAYYAAGQAPDSMLVPTFGVDDKAVLQQMLETGFSKAGQAVGLEIWQQDPTNLMGNSRYHAVTCWGYETDAAGGLAALYLTDSDDREYGALRVEVAAGYAIDPDMGNIPMLNLLTDAPLDGFGGQFHVSLAGVVSLDTPVGVAAPVVADFPEIAAQTCIATNVKIGDSEYAEGSGLQFGNGRDAMIAAGGAGSMLFSFGYYQGGDGVTVSRGAMLSMESLASVFHQGAALVNEGKTYLHNGEVQFYGNISEDCDGAGVRNSGYLEIKDGADILFAFNEATGSANGGAIANTGTVSLRGNASITFMENAAGGAGHDIYNAEGATLSIADNGSVIFISGTDTVSIANRGDLYLANGSGQSIAFLGSGLDSRSGTVYIGRDAAGHCSGMDGAVDFIGDNFFDCLSVSAKETGGVAVLKDVQVNATGVTGGNSGSVAHAAFDSNAALSFSGVRMDDVAVTLTGADLHLQAVTINAADCVFSVEEGSIFLADTVIDLSSVCGVLDTATMVYSYDLGGLFGSSAVSGSLTLSGLAEAESYVFNCGESADFERLCREYAATLLPAAEQAPVADETCPGTPAVVDALKDPELAVAAENPAAAVTLGGADSVATGSDSLTQVMATPELDGNPAELPEGGVTLLPEGAEMTEADMAAVAAGLQAAGLAGDAAAQYLRTLEAARTLSGLYNPVLMAAGGADSASGTVPEPATGMLSLLAMAGLAARRRRK